MSDGVGGAIAQAETPAPLISCRCYKSAAFGAGDIKAPAAEPSADRPPVEKQMVYSRVREDARPQARLPGILYAR